MLKTFPAQRLRDFYRDFYRPDRMALVAVGDFDTERIEALIREHFGTLSAAASGSRMYPVQLNPGTRYVAVSDPEAQGSSVTLVQKRPLRAVSNAGDFRASLVRGLVAMINARFTEIARRADAPFLGASVGEARSDATSRR